MNICRNTPFSNQRDRQMRIITVLTFLLVSWMSMVSIQIPDALIERFKGRHLKPIEGLWLWNSGALVAIESDDYGHITLTIVETNDPAVPVPFVIGTGKFTGHEGQYDLELITGGDAIPDTDSKKKLKFIARKTGEHHLTLNQYSTGYKINLWRLVPYLFRYSITKEKEPADLNGAMRIWPTAGTPEYPVIL